MHKTAIARHRRNKKIYKKLSMSLCKIVRKTKKILAFRKRTSRKKARPNYRFDKMSLKFATFILLIAMGTVTLSTSGTNSFYNDIENSVGNIFQASTLGVGVSGEFVSGVVRLGEATTTDIVLSKLDTNNLDYQYFASTTLIGDDTFACDYITISASSSPQDYVDVPLKDFVSATSTPMDPNQWDFIFKVDKDAPDSVIGKICNFKISYMAWQTNLPDNSGGFSDIAEINGSIEIGPLAPPVTSGVVLNEFLPNPDGILCTDGGSSCAPGDPNFIFDFGSDSDDKPQGEWVELYNNGSASVNLTGWYLADATPGNGNETPINTDHILVPSPVIPAHGWLVVYMNKPVYNNPGDTVRLFNASGTQVDSYSYGVDPTFCDMEPTPNGSNDTNGSGGSCNSSNVPGNKSFARIPDGTGEWVDPIPTPGKPNKVEEIVVETSAIANEILGGGSSGGGASDIVQNMEVANTTPSVIETEQADDNVPAEEDVVSEEDATTPVVTENNEGSTTTEATSSEGTSTEPSGDSNESTSELPATEPEPAVIPSEPEGPVVSGPEAVTEPVIVPEPVVEVAPVAEPPAPAPEPPPSE